MANINIQRVNGSLSMNQLKDEWKARGMKGYSNVDKTRLLIGLGDDTILMSALPEYKYMENIKKIMAQEKKDKDERVKQEEKQKLEDVRQRQADESRRQEQERINQIAEYERQKYLHEHEIQYHKCLVALTADLVHKDQPRYNGAECNNCQNPSCCLFSCARCDWDICQSCIEVLNKRDEEARTQKLLREQQELAKKLLREQDILIQKPLHTLKVKYHDCLLAPTNLLKDNSEAICSWGDDSDECYNECILSCLDCDFHICGECAEIAEKINKKRKRGDKIIGVSYLASNIVHPDIANKDKMNLLKYVVWTSCGYGNDSWHRNNPPPTKEFDSSYDKLEDANLRVKYKMFVDNPWGVSRSELEDSCEFEENYDTKGFLRMFIHPDDSEMYEAAVVPRDAFHYI